MSRANVYANALFASKMQPVVLSIDNLTPVNSPSSAQIMYEPMVAYC